MADEERDDLLGGAADEFRRTEDGDDDDFEPDGGEGGGKKKLLLILAPLLLMGGGAGVYFSGLLDEKTEEAVVAEAPVEQKPAKSIYFDLPEIIVNLNSVGSKPSYLKLRASLELEEGTDTTLLSRMEPRIIDKLQVYMRELRLSDLRAGDGLVRLRAELRIQINKAVTPIEISQVLFRNILVQ